MLWWIFSVVFVQDYKVNLVKCELIDVVSAWMWRLILFDCLEHKAGCTPATWHFSPERQPLRSGAELRHLHRDWRRSAVVSHHEEGQKEPWIALFYMIWPGDLERPSRICTKSCCSERSLEHLSEPVFMTLSWKILFFFFLRSSFCGRLHDFVPESCDFIETDLHHQWKIQLR